MAYSSYIDTYLQFIRNIGSYLAGNSSAPTLDLSVNITKDLNTLRNSSSAEHLITTSNAIYDQVAISRTLKEIYKKPKDYFSEFQASINNEIKKTEFNGDEFAKQQTSIEQNINKSKGMKNISPALQYKLSLIDPSV